MLEARPHAVEAIAKTATPIRNIRRRPSESPSAPPARTRADKRIPYDTTTHCTSTRFAWKDVSSAGTATLTTVLSTNAMLEPRIVAARIHGCFALTQGDAFPRRQHQTFVTRRLHRVEDARIRTGGVRF